MNLIVDIGNSLVKLAVFEKGVLVAQRSARYPSASDFEALLQGRRAGRAIVESTRGDADEVVTSDEGRAVFTHALAVALLAQRRGERLLVQCGRLGKELRRDPGLQREPARQVHSMQGMARHHAPPIVRVHYSKYSHGRHGYSRHAE